MVVARCFLGGVLRRRFLSQVRGELRDVLKLAGSAWLAVSGCFVITNGSFYWFSARVAHTSMAGWIENFSDWYLSYIGSALLYIAFAAAVHTTLRTLRLVRTAR
jgi:hypothetical protein